MADRFRVVAEALGSATAHGRGGVWVVVEDRANGASDVVGRYCYEAVAGAACARLNRENVALRIDRSGSR